LFVIEPASHAAQSLAAAEPVVPTYLPAVQSVHVATSDATEYFPTAHAVQLLAPALLSVFVIEPASHAAQAASVESTE
jgi:hypothetical protein